MFLGAGADIGDFFSSLSERESLLLRPTFYLPILVAWSVSILQFIFVQNHDELKRVQEGSNTYLKVLDTYEEIIMKTKRKDFFPADGVASKKAADELRDVFKTTRKPKTFVQKVYLYAQSHTWINIQTVLTQDGPFLAVRIINLLYWEVRTYTSYYFTMKNILVVVLEAYRSVANHLKLVNRSSCGLFARLVFGWVLKVHCLSLHGGTDARVSSNKRSDG